MKRERVRPTQTNPVFPNNVRTSISLDPDLLADVNPAPTLKTAKGKISRYIQNLIEADVNPAPTTSNAATKN